MLNHFRADSSEESITADVFAGRAGGMMEMKKQDMEEFYQLLALYKKTYGTSYVAELLKEVAQRYGREYGKNILEERNPRNSGRKRQYTEEDRAKIRSQRGKGKSIRKIAKKQNTL